MHVFCCSKVTVALRYADLVSVLPTRIRVLAWPVHQSRKSSSNSSTTSRKENGGMTGQASPVRLSYAEDALRNMSLPEGVISFQVNSIFFVRH